jgi:hypothetical protein
MCRYKLHFGTLSVQTVRCVINVCVYIYICAHLAQVGDACTAIDLRNIRDHNIHVRCERTDTDAPSDDKRGVHDITLQF